jgi:hypothetical protein
VAYRGISMSERAAAAYEAGLVPASKAARGVPASLVHKWCPPAEWHHTGARYRQTAFFDPHQVSVAFGLEPPCGSEECGCAPDQRAIAALERYRQERRAEPNVQKLHGCTVEWLEWAGTRKRPRPVERRAEGATIEVKGGTATVTLPDGTTFRKRLNTTGFRFSVADAAQAQK